MTCVARMESVNQDVQALIRSHIRKASSLSEAEEVIAVALVTVASFFETPEVAVKFLMEVAK